MSEYYSLYTDGSYLQYLDVAGIGGYLLDINDEKIFEFSEIIQDKELYEKHEIAALEHALLKSIDLNIKKLHCFSDDKQLCSICNIKDTSFRNVYIERNPALLRVIKLLDKFDSIDFTYIPRKNNKKADDLSHKAIIEKHGETIQVVDGGFKVDNLYCIEQFKKSEKDNFTLIKSNIENFLVFEVNAKKNNVEVKITKAFKDKITKDITIEPRTKLLLSNKNWIPSVITCIADSLNLVSSKKFSITISGNYSNVIQSILRGRIPIGKKTHKPLEILSEKIKNFDTVIIHTAGDILDKINPPLKEEELKKISEMNKRDFFIQAIKILGDDYILGQNKLIEKYFELPLKKKEDVAEIQKKYFGEIVKITFNEMQSQKINPKLKQNHIELLKKSLEKQGVKFKY